MSEKASKGRFRKPEKLQNHTNEGKGKEKTKEPGEGKEKKKKKSNGCTLSFYNSYFEYSFWPKKTVGRKGTFDDNVFKNPARYIQLKICYYFRSRKC